MGREAALSLGNRSVVFFNQSDYDRCLDDLEGALLYGYPQDLQYKLFERKGRCLQALGKGDEARESLKRAVEMLDMAKVPADSVG